MRTLLPLASLLFVLPAAAQETKLLPPSARTWIYVSAITSFEPEEYTGALRSQGFSEEGMSALRNYVIAGNEVMDTLARQNAEELCAHAAELDPEKLAQEFERQEAETDAVQQRLVDSLDDALGPGDAATLEWMMEHDVFMKVTALEGTGFDHSALARSGSLTPADVADRACRVLERS